jgi:hypothetical protein
MKLLFCFMKCDRKIPGLGQESNADLAYSILAAISLKIRSLLGNIYSDLFVFSMRQKHHAIPFGCQTLFQNVIPSVPFSILEMK